jgi:acyl carrier protein
VTHEEVHRRLTAVFRDVFDAPSLEISDSTTADDIDDWDSVNHITLIAAVETEFKISLSTREVKNLANVGDFMKLIESKAR